MTIDEVRRAIADAVSATGLHCEPYAPDNPVPPCAFIDTVTVNRERITFCGLGAVTVTLLTIDQRNDRPGAMQNLEGRIPQLVETLTALGLQVGDIKSGTTTVSGEELPAVAYSLTVTL